MSILWKVGIPLALFGAYLALNQPTEGERLQADIERLQAMQAELAADTRRAQLDCIADGIGPHMAPVREVCLAGAAAVAEANAATARALQARIDRAIERLAR